VIEIAEPWFDFGSKTNTREATGGSSWASACNFSFSAERDSTGVDEKSRPADANPAELMSSGDLIMSLLEFDLDIAGELKGLLPICIPSGLNPSYSSDSSSSEPTSVPLVLCLL